MKNRIKEFIKGTMGLRTIKSNGKVWFSAPDVATALDLKNIRQNMKSVRDPHVCNIYIGVITGTTKTGKPAKQKVNMQFVDETGLYILTAKSRKKEAVDFLYWVCEEVLPSIRKNGGYIAGQESLDEKQKIILEKEIKKLSEVIDNLTEKNEILKNENEELTAEISELMYSRNEDAYISTNDGGYVTETEYEKYYA